MENKIISIGENTLGFRIFFLILGMSFLFLFIFFIYSLLTHQVYTRYVFILALVLGLLTWYFFRKSKYTYTIENGFLFIKNNKKIYKIPLSDIKNVYEMDNIPFMNKFFIKFNSLERKLYLCPFAKKGIVLELPTHSIVICPRKFEKIKKYLSM